MVTVLPSRYDTFNLVAVESLLAGCPTAIGSGAGVCRFLDETFPGVPYLRIDMDQPLACLPELESLLANYDDYRNCLVERSTRPSLRSPAPAWPRFMPARRRFDATVREEAAEWHRLLMDHKPAGTLLDCAARRRDDFVHRHTTAEFRRTVKSWHPRRVAGRTKRACLEKLRNGPLRERSQRRALQQQAQHFAARYHAIGWMAENNADELQIKLHHTAQLISDLRIDRVRLWREMARLEQLRENDLVAATYRLRAMRLAGGDRFHDLPWVTRTLAEGGYTREAEAAQAMYSASDDGHARCQELLETALDSHRSYRPQDFERVDDRRSSGRCRVSVVVSLYDAADKLPLFLQTLSLQTLVRSRQADVVLIDSGSPGDEYRVFRDWAERSGASAVYARSSQRESIQAAWNRGIELAHGDHLSFLGVDEAILPQTLELLADELDADPGLDWVQANSLVTNVNERGHWLNDIMTYDRTNYDQPLVYLETCYLSYVGALYRRRIHDRFGYYDASFGAAGDTEFKNRVLPYIRSRVIPRTLGVFWNYPSGQTTCSPRAEIEDLRAWYLHRTLGGVRYALQNLDLSAAESLLHSSLQYRKSYCRHWSTDVEYAHNLAEFLRSEHADTSAVELYDGVCQLLETYRLLDCLPHVSQESLYESLMQAKQIARQVAEQHRRLAVVPIEPVYDVFNDNRHEQHNHIWCRGVAALRTALTRHCAKEFSMTSLTSVVPTRTRQFIKEAIGVERINRHLWDLDRKTAAAAEMDARLVAAERGVSDLAARTCSLEARLRDPRREFPTAYWYDTSYAEPCVALALRDLCRPGNVVFDVGANCGALSILMSRLVGPKGVVCSFEASRRIVDKCQYNLVVNGCHNSQLFHCAVYSRSGETLKIYHGTHLNDTVVQELANTQNYDTVETVSLDDFVAELGLHPKVIKMDIEGAEYDALLGRAARWPATARSSCWNNNPATRAASICSRSWVTRASTWPPIRRSRAPPIFRAASTWRTCCSCTAR